VRRAVAIRVRPALALLVALAALGGAPAAAEARDCPRTSLGDVEDEVMCPVCGTPLALATDAPQAQRERAYVERLISACRSKDEIKRALVAQYGERVLALPGDEGGDEDLGDVLVYVVPALGIVLALGGIAFALVRWRGGRGRAAERRVPRAADTGRLDADMERYDL
jgi:cytochrome c-type biogenesis protein CcmH